MFGSEFLKAFLAHAMEFVVQWEAKALAETPAETTEPAVDAAPAETPAN